MTDMLDKIKSWFFKPTQHFQIRYNTKVEGGDLVWRIIADGQESLASSIEIRGYMYGESSTVDNERKMNIACDGKIYWHGTRAEIITSKAPDLLP
jgi:hypothetical protein